MTLTYTRHISNILDIDEGYKLYFSLGATRTLNVSNKTYDIQHCDAIIFGSSTHGIPRDSKIKDGRISIALFLEK